MDGGGVMDEGTRDRLVLCGQAAIDALSLDHDHDSPNGVTEAIDRIRNALGNLPEIIGLHGPEKCPAGACDGCEGFHHWLPECHDEDTASPPGIGPHPAIAAGHVTWYECKHCSAWAEDIRDDWPPIHR